MISPTERKQQEEKKNSSYFLSPPKLVYYVYLTALHEEAVRPWTCNDPCFHTEHMRFSAGVCLERASCQLSSNIPEQAGKQKHLWIFPFKKEMNTSSRVWIVWFYETLPILWFYNWTHPCRCWMLRRSALFACMAPSCSILSCVTQHL